MDFSRLKHFIKTGEEAIPLTVNEKIDLAKLHFEKSIEFKGEKVGVLEMRRHFSNYFKGLSNFKETRLRLVTCNDVAEIFNILDEIRVKWGNSYIDQDLDSGRSES